MWKFSRNNYSNSIIINTYQWKDVSLKFNNKIKGTFIEKWFNYWKLLARDYKDVGVNLKMEVRQKPLKAATYFTGISFLSYCVTSNPDLRSFKSKYIESANELALVNPSLTNPTSVTHLKYIEKCFNANLIRYINLGVFSIVWVDEFSKDCDTYECKCSYLQVPYRHFGTRILDVGFLNTWWVISRRMLDYDVNE
ncbi:mitochondrial import inner membrane translocase subunit Tim29 [Diorhabda sublineata]|uniref:mitochondrial import inner membrane translocase subunit Tim29 n=1 Tax=Diorhabda sublineata TaxID=1163346 RepID=UPI0024E0B1BB|nr:mitochondrial import inner membrane translocase subunit Tim29 [Diorhabda sublineata]